MSGRLQRGDARICVWRSTRMRSSGADLGLPTFDPKLCTKSHAILNQGDVPPDVCADATQTYPPVHSSRPAERDLGDDLVGWALG
jgi:hypothetical protein